jgi:class 3 adenylate cyclase
MVSAGQLMRRATVDFGHAHEIRHKLIVAGITASVCCLLLIPLLVGNENAAIEHVELPLQSARVQMFEDNSQRDPEIVIINIDDAALAYGDWPDFSGGKIDGQARDNRYAWPWPRSVYNKIIRYCREGGARVVVFDLILSETGPNTNQAKRTSTTDGNVTDFWTLDRAGDDLFVLEACARDDVAVAVAAQQSGRKLELRDELLKRYALKVEGEPGDYVDQLRASNRFGPYNSGAVPFAGLLDGVPDFLAHLRGPDHDDAERMGNLEGYEDLVNNDVDFASVLNLRSLSPVATRDSVHGVGGAGVVNVFEDVDSNVRAYDLAGFSGQTACAGLPLETFRLYVLSYAREAQANKALREKFAERFPGLSVDDKGLYEGQRLYTLDKKLRDVPLKIEGKSATYLSRTIELDSRGRLLLRYRNMIDYRDMPRYKLDPENYAKLGGTEDVFAVYPSVSARDVLYDYDARDTNKRLAEAQAEVDRLKEAFTRAEGDAAIQIRKDLEVATNNRARYPAQPVVVTLGEPQSLVKDKVVFIAGTAAGLYDSHATPLDANTPGTWIIATAFDNLKNGDVMHEQPRWQAWVFAMLACCAAVGFTFFVRRMRYSFVWLLVSAAMVAGAAWLAFSMQFWFHASAPLAGLFLGFSGGALAKALTEGRQKAQREAFARQYMGTELVDYVIKTPQALKLGGENREMSIYFSDVAGFTTVTETLGPEHPDRLVELLNIYLERMTDIMLESGGVIDKYIGDAIMCFWGAPKTMEDHAVRACKGALACKAEMARMQPLFADAVRNTAPQLIKPDGTVLAARAGINSGIVTVGNMGSSKRFAYTVMGDAVNLASRLEGQNKEYGSWIMLGENAEKLVRGEFTTRRLDLLVVKGKTKPTEVFELLGPKEAPQFILDLVRDFERGVENFRNREFEHALEWFKTSLQNEPDKDIDNPSALYIERCETFLQTPPPPDWNGVFVKKTK